MNNNILNDCPPCLLYGGKELEKIFHDNNTKRGKDQGDYNGDSHIKLSYNIYRRFNTNGDAAQFRDLYMNWYSNAGENAGCFYSNTAGLLSKCEALHKDYEKRLLNNPRTHTYNCVKLCRNAKMSSHFCELCPLSKEYINDRLSIENAVLGYSILNHNTDFLRSVAAFATCDYKYSYYEDVATRFTGSCVLPSLNICNINALIAYYILLNCDELNNPNSELSKKLDTAYNKDFDTFYELFVQLLFDTFITLSPNTGVAKKFPNRDYYGGISYEDVLSGFKKPITEIIAIGKVCDLSSYNDYTDVLMHEYIYSDYNILCDCSDSVLYVNRIKTPQKIDISTINSFSNNNLVNSILLDSPLMHSLQVQGLNKKTNDSIISNSNIIKEDINSYEQLKKDVSIDGSNYESVLNETAELPDTSFEASNIDSSASMYYSKSNDDKSTVFDPLESKAGDESNIIKEPEVIKEPLEVLNNNVINEDVNFDNKLNLSSLLLYSICEFGFEEDFKSFINLDDATLIKYVAKCLYELQGSEPIAVECCWHPKLERYGILIYVQSCDSYWYVMEDCPGFNDICWHLFLSNRIKVCINSVGIMSLLRKLNIRYKKLYSLTSLFYAANSDTIFKELPKLSDIIGFKLQNNINIYKQILPAYTKRYDYFMDLIDETNNHESSNKLLQSIMNIETLLSFSYDMSDILSAPLPHINISFDGSFSFAYKKEYLIENSGFTIIKLSVSYDKEQLKDNFSFVEFYKALLKLMQNYSYFVRYNIRLLFCSASEITFACPTDIAYTVNDILTDAAKTTYSDFDSKGVPGIFLSLVSK